MIEEWPWYVILSNGTRALVDEVDYTEARKYLWSATTQGGYAVTNLSGTREERKARGYKQLMLHSLILQRMGLQANSGQLPDHKNRNKLDCRRNNLRFVSRNFNNHNAIKRRKNSYLPPGVQHNRNKFRAVIRVDGEEFRLGTFETIGEAEKAYKQACLRYYGETLDN